MAAHTNEPSQHDHRSTQIATVVLVDDHPVVRAGVAAVLASLEGVRMVGEAGSAEEGLDLVEQHAPALVVMDVRLPGMDGIEACAILRQRHPRTNVILFTQFAHESVLMRAFAAGAHGFVVKDSDADALRQALDAVMAGRKFIDPRVASRLIGLATRGRRATGPYGLTVTEMQVVQLLPRGASNRDIARELGISLDTVKTHMKHILRKFGAADRAQVVAIAVREGLA